MKNQKSTGRKSFFFSWGSFFLLSLYVIIPGPTQLTPWESISPQQRSKRGSGGLPAGGHLVGI
jgi:hypothetical protein